MACRVTGAAGDMGRGISRCFVAEGVNLVAVCRNTARSRGRPRRGPGQRRRAEAHHIRGAGEQLDGGRARPRSTDARPALKGDGRPASTVVSTSAVESPSNWIQRGEDQATIATFGIAMMLVFVVCWLIYRAGRGTGRALAGGVSA